MGITQSKRDAIIMEAPVEETMQQQNKNLNNKYHELLVSYY